MASLYIRNNRLSEFLIASLPVELDLSIAGWMTKFDYILMWFCSMLWHVGFYFLSTQARLSAPTHWTFILIVLPILVVGIMIIYVTYAKTRALVKERIGLKATYWMNIPWVIFYVWYFSLIACVFCDLEAGQ